MTRVVLTYLLWINTGALCAQDWSDVLTFGGHGFSQGVRIEYAEGGSKYLAGHLQNSEFGESAFTVLCDTLYPSGRSPHAINSFIIKFSSENTIVWKRSIPGRIQDVFVDAEFNYYVVGYFEHGVEFGNTIYDAVGFGDAYAVKYNDEGVVQWARIVTGNQSNRLISITANNHKELILSGINNDPSILLPNVFLPRGSYILKLSNSDGSVLAVKTFSSNRFWISTLEVDQFDDIILGGSYQGQLLFNDSLYTSHGGHWDDGFLAKLDSNFGELWFRSFGSSDVNVDEVRAVKADGSHYFFAGVFSGKMIVDGVEYTAKGKNDSYIGRIDHRGHLVWLNIFGGLLQERIFDLAINPSYVCVTGEYASEIRFPSMTLVPNGVSDLFVLKFQKDGTFVHAYTAGNINQVEYHFLYADLGNSLVIDESNNIFVTGKVSGAGRFGSLPVRSVGASDCYFAVISESPESANFEDAICVESDSRILVYPNPTRGMIKLKSDMPIVKALIYDATGREIGEYNPYVDSLNIDISHLANSVYYLRIATENGVEYIKVIKQ